MQEAVFFCGRDLQCPFEASKSGFGALGGAPGEFLTYQLYPKGMVSESLGIDIHRCSKEAFRSLELLTFAGQRVDLRTF